MYWSESRSLAEENAAAGLPVRDLRGYLVGRWQFQRRIDDQKSVMSGDIRGAAVFANSGPGAGGGGLSYREEGRFDRPNQPSLVCSQTYSYQILDLGSAEVYFPDGRFFHRLDLRRGRWEVEHSCGPDLYRGQFVVISPDCWTTVWRVSGPRKDAVLTSRFNRLAAATG